MAPQPPALPSPSEADRLRSLKQMTMVIYALQAASVLIVTSPICLIAGVMVNYIKGDDVRGTWLESHFRWQIRTFWYTLLWLSLGILLLLAIIGYFILIAAGIWLLYRVIKGWIFLMENKPMHPGAPISPSA